MGRLLKLRQPDQRLLQARVEQRLRLAEQRLKLARLQAEQLLELARLQVERLPRLPRLPVVSHQGSSLPRAKV